MSILNELSSQAGDRTEQSNLKVAAQCAARPSLLDEISGGLNGTDAALAGDCAEVFTEVAKQAPDLVVPYAKSLTGLLAHPTTRVRWEAMHALALIARLAPDAIAPILPRLGEMIRDDTSVIVRDYAVDAVGSYAATSPKAARAAYPILMEALTVWDGKQAAHALNGLAHVASAVPSLDNELLATGIRYHDSGRGIVQKAAKALIKAIEKT
jgi:hypothetical protein